MVLVSLGAVIITLCAWLTIPFAIPFTLQTFGVFAVLFLLGGKRGTLSVLLYIALGAIGLPVFSGFNSGLGVVLGPTGGFVFGFLSSGALFWALEAFAKKHKLFLLCAAFLSLALCYALGTVWYMYYSHSGALSALAVCVLPYALPDLLKILLAYAVATRVLKSVKL